MGQECSCQCGDQKSEMDFEGVSHIPIFLLRIELLWKFDEHYFKIKFYLALTRCQSYS